MKKDWFAVWRVDGKETPNPNGAHEKLMLHSISGWVWLQTSWSFYSWKKIKFQQNIFHILITHDYTKYSNSP